MHGHWVTIRNNTKSMNKDNSWYELVKCIFPVWKTNVNFESLSTRLPSPSKFDSVWNIFHHFFTTNSLQIHLYCCDHEYCCAEGLTLLGLQGDM